VNDTAADLIENGWRQGAFLTVKKKNLSDEQRNRIVNTRINEKDRRPEGKNRLKEGEVLVAVSQDCDIAASVSHEPYVEFLVFSLEDKPHDKNFFTKSSRYLNLEISCKIFKASIWKGVYIDKSILAELKPCGFLPTEETVTVAVWRANRYIRSALPDSFNKKFFPVLEKAENVSFFYTHSVSIRGIYVILDSYEEREEYEVGIIALLRHDISPDEYQEVLNFFDEFLNEIDSIEGFTEAHNNDVAFDTGRNFKVEIESPVYRETEISVGELSMYKKVHLDYISLKGGILDLGEPHR